MIWHQPKECTIISETPPQNYQEHLYEGWIFVHNRYMGVSKNRGTPKWMVYSGKPYEQMDDLGVFPLFLVQHPYNCEI